MPDVEDNPLPFDDAPDTAKPVTPTAPVIKPKRQGNYANAAYKIVELNDEQKAFVASHWMLPEWDLKRLTQHVFNDPALDGHHTEGKSVRAYITTLGDRKSVV